MSRLPEPNDAVLECSWNQRDRSAGTAAYIAVSGPSNGTARLRRRNRDGPSHAKLCIQVLKKEGRLQVSELLAAGSSWSSAVPFVTTHGGPGTPNAWRVLRSSARLPRSHSRLPASQRHGELDACRAVGVGAAAPALAAGMLSSLTAAQRKVAEQIACGYTDRQIARRLHITEATVRDHCKAIAARLRLRRSLVAVIVHLAHVHTCDVCGGTQRFSVAARRSQQTPTSGDGRIATSERTYG